MTSIESRSRETSAGDFIPGMPRRKGWTWLEHASPNKRRPPIAKLLARSVYYPASGLDWRPLRYLHRHFGSYVYADYGLARERVAEAITTIPGFELVGLRAITEHDLGVHMWTMPALSEHEHAMWTGRPDRKFETTYFGVWALLNSPTGERTSLLYLCKDGVQVYQSLYGRNRVVPACLALIQPGHAFGGNWTNFYDQSGPLGRSVHGHAIGVPEYLLFGGIGDPASYRTPCWATYRECMSPLEPGLNLWRTVG